ncbi:class I SAM-dependent methyltransferase [Oleidesulfovibrio alaskensis]|jgi:2-polyprenyl-6-hydroxyphenyl methylase/3-demethylubiquinone-9 3-methyltransferase|uniref:class I SAM-dependent methyltransferase n=1 Tax=Oleidesulfovibrio alaskensis TaxID=58180 RepID=UPI001A58D105|nr:class I SAM-dependent methyltransferase [Oleidesulfovibrio alaskensis]MBL3583709.1 class I SAM-dependent methyltransferase [Oleidesulfovibrio alaskensis]
MNSDTENRFAFGKNWQKYSTVVSEKRIQDAVSHLQNMLQVTRLDGKTFLDIGSGSGIFSLAACRLGAKVHSFDYDANSVKATESIRQRYYTSQGKPEDQWIVEQGSVLDTDYMKSLGTFDIVYSWGVLHHTGSQWDAIDAASKAVVPEGQLFIALYNDQGIFSRMWKQVKKTYVSGRYGRYAMTMLFIPLAAIAECTRGLLKHRNPFYTFSNYKTRGMTPFYDWFDWIGGYPFEVSKPEDVVDYLVNRSFLLQKITTVGGGLGNNQFVFINKTKNTQTSCPNSF